jgi:hypothetical protein
VFDRPLSRFRPVVSAAVLLLTVVPVAMAQNEEPLPDGMPVKRWIVAPYISTLYTYDDNIFRSSGETDIPSDQIVSDQISSVLVGVGATMPIRNSRLGLRYEGGQYNYADNEFERTATHEGEVKWAMNFGSFDQLVLRDVYIQSFSQLINVDEGGELVFDGQPYNRNQWEIGFNRTVPRRRGYTVSLTRIDLVFQAPPEKKSCDRETSIQEECVTFFDYRGFQGTVEYREPLAGRKWFTGYATARRFDHYNDPFPEDDDPELDPGVPFRREVSESLQAGIRGFLGPRQPYFFRIGYGRMRYDLVDSSEFRGLVGAARFRFSFGPRTHLDLGVDRRPLPSSFDTYYLVNDLRAEVRRLWLRSSEVGINLFLSRAEYGDILTRFGEPICGEEIRVDRRRGLEAFVDWSVAQRMGFRVTAGRLRRTSNCEGAGYTANEVSIGVNFGWY